MIQKMMQVSTTQVAWQQNLKKGWVMSIFILLVSGTVSARPVGERRSCSVSRQQRGAVWLAPLYRLSPLHRLSGLLMNGNDVLDTSDLWRIKYSEITGQSRSDVMGSSGLGQYSNITLAMNCLGLVLKLQQLAFIS